MGTKVNGFICVILCDNTLLHINVDHIQSYKDFEISTENEIFDVKENAEQISQSINEAIEFLNFE